MGSEKKRKKKQIKRNVMKGESQEQEQEQKQKAGFKIILKRFIKLNKSFISAFCLVIFLIIISKALTALINIIIGIFFDYILDGNYSVFYKGIIVLCIIQLIKSIIQYQINYRANYTSEECIRNMRNYTYTHVTKASMRWLDSNKIGDIISRVNGDLNIFVEVVYKFLTYQLSNIIDFIVSVIACFFVSWKLAVVSFALIPVIGGLQMLIGKPIAKWGEKRATAEGKANAIFIDLLNGIAILKAFGIDKEMYQKHEKEVNNTVNASIKSYTIEFLLLPLQFIMSFAPMILLLSVGCIFVIRKEITFGILLSFILLSNNAINIISGLSYQVREIYNMIGIANRIFEIWDVELEDKGGTEDEKKDEIPIRFNNVKFCYREGIPILNGINFTVKKGEKIALVGESGAGKSTIVKLLAGFYEKSEGNIYVFGNRIEEWNKRNLRQYMSYVGQDAYLFPGSILSNVLLAREGATEEEARKVIEEVGLGSLDITADNGEGGINLSGGQRQRVCIARVLLKNSDIILLDEPTSALDTESEACVNAAFEKLSGDKACIIIAHRLSAIHNVERIICLRDGKIVEEGSHDELMKLGGVYFELYQKQDREVLQYETEDKE